MGQISGQNGIRRCLQFKHVGLWLRQNGLFHRNKRLISNNSGFPTLWLERGNQRHQLIKELVVIQGCIQSIMEQLDDIISNLIGRTEQHKTASLPAKLFFKVVKENISGKTGQVSLDKDHGWLFRNNLLATPFKIGDHPQTNVLLIRQSGKDLPQTWYIRYQKQFCHDFPRKIEVLYGMTLLLSILLLSRRRQNPLALNHNNHVS